MNKEINKNGEHSGMLAESGEGEGRKKVEERKGRKGD
jgi:hypothetical protein